MNYKTIIGLEVHVELKTKSKMFCSCSADYFGQKPNSQTCPVCLGLPGALPVPNQTAIEWCVLIGMALNCKIPNFSKFDRKNYFYPDLSKGYQISQAEQPFAENGYVVLSSGKKIHVKRVHMEEDTGKLIHAVVDDKNVSLIDFNRSGVPLVEIVTEPDFETAEEVKEYLQKLQQIVRYLNVSNADMEKGNMRLEPNISLQKEGETDLPKYKVEVKNINSFSFVSKAIEYEIKRQKELLEEGKTPLQETRGFVEKNSSTVSQRVKEEASDYRYFPEPDIPPITWSQSKLSELSKMLPELPEAKLARFVKQFNLSTYDAEILTREIELAGFFTEAVKVAKDKLTPKQIANYIINKKVNTSEILPAKLIEEIIAATKTEDIDTNELKTIIKEVLAKHPQIKTEYANGKENIVQFAVGQVMYILKRKIDINVLRELILEEIK
jgi:aspartyl-tRNA(Asn)/glutamyl-tRNA(Gln) amidotransferase subunit B